MRTHLFAGLGLAALACASPVRPLALTHVVLYRNGIGHFEHAGHVEGSHFRLSLKAREVDDVIKTLTVVDRGSGAGHTVSAVLPAASKDGGPVTLDVTLSGGPSHDLLVSYAVPTPVWKTTYRIALPDPGGKAALLQSWAIVDNATDQAWSKVRLTLASGAPLSFATDLRTPRYLERPRADGYLIAPVATGAVISERTQATDQDGFQDGTPGDRDGDGIPDDVDKCPDEPETPNGYQDSDGCPDAGRVMVSEQKLEILERVAFAHDSDSLGKDTGALLDAVAAVLKQNPRLRRVAIQGHASDDEVDPWGLSARRATAVLAALKARSVPTTLELRPFGATQPRDARPDDAARQRNRRVEFVIIDDGQAPATASQPLGARTLAASAPASVLPTDVAGMVRYQVADPVSVPRGAQTLVSIINREVPGEDVLLYRPEVSVPGSATYPLRAARIVNGSGLMLEGGAVAIFARGGFVGEGLLARLHEDETAFIPYALDGSTSVRVESNDGEEPVRLTSLSRGVLTVENAAVHVTTYQIHAGRQSPARLFVRQPRRAGYHAVALPPGSQDNPDALIVPVPLTGARESQLSIREETKVTRQVSLESGDPEALAVYASGTSLAPALAAQLGAVVAIRREQAQHAGELERLRQALGDTARRLGELRESLRTLEKIPGGGALRDQLMRRLGDATTQSEALSRKLAAGSLAESEARDRLSAAIEALSLEP